MRERAYEEIWVLADFSDDSIPISAAIRLHRREDGALILRGPLKGHEILIPPEAAKEFGDQVAEAVKPRTPWVYAKYVDAPPREPWGTPHVGDKPVPYGPTKNPVVTAPYRAATMTDTPDTESYLSLSAREALGRYQCSAGSPEVIDDTPKD